MVNIAALSPYYNPHAQAGDEVSSTYEGRHVCIIEIWLNHLRIGDWPHYVSKGQPVSFFDGVGVALTSGKSWLDEIVIDTEGIWRLEVECTGAGWGNFVVPGQTLYIDDDGLITDDPTFAVAVFGYALQPIWGLTDGTPALIAVKVHWMTHPVNGGS